MKFLKKTAFVMASVMFLTACSSAMEINGTTYRPYGLLNADARRNPNVDYEVAWGNVVIAFILMETVIVPLYVIGFDCMEPVGPSTGMPH